MSLTTHFNEIIKNEIHNSIETFTKVLDDHNLLTLIEEIAAFCTNQINLGHKLIFAGNGGSAADSQHLAAELVSKLNYDRPGLAAIAITTDTSALTAIGNDYGYQYSFSRQIEALGNRGDVFFAISTSGNSANILNAIESAKNRGITVIGLTGEPGGKMATLCDYVIQIPSKLTPKIQEGHIMLGHIICALIEEAIFGMEYNPKTAMACAL
ncbi:D-sedoheptulose 7-phosphate isomerase [Rickettsiales endosymbiont of Stachyamoeba lipophora]|uniref:D-sedoheptulose 7-phosphate isomerase n=1 Tax=Rickettsiales endosymbiont of Stachyamoeba lipophora TaxID=2486578 RepID=UPI000F648CD5|nr:D-sedoheptulose 7-phosphate isomerase [Rickettsiales endosymbiont of Stachyamoeba lipophora]AZL15674.1 SIS domain-containing protein [Rickettsiales endosymbiont of Stachyamoeba lipophora]